MPDKKKEIGRRTFPGYPGVELIFYKDPNSKFPVYMRVEMRRKKLPSLFREKLIEIKRKSGDYKSIMTKEAEKFENEILMPLDNLKKSSQTPPSDSEPSDPYEGIEEIF